MDNIMHNVLRHHWLMPISCHFQDCKALLVTSLTHVSGTIQVSRLLRLVQSVLNVQYWRGVNWLLFRWHYNVWSVSSVWGRFYPHCVDRVHGADLDWVADGCADRSYVALSDDRRRTAESAALRRISLHLPQLLRSVSVTTIASCFMVF